MTTTPLISRLVFTPATSQARQQGLLGHAEFDLLDLVRLNVGVRRSLAGQIVLSFPVRKDARGHSHPIFRPTGQAARDLLTAAVIEWLPRGLGTASHRRGRQGDSAGELA